MNLLGFISADIKAEAHPRDNGVHVSLGSLYYVIVKYNQGDFDQWNKVVTGTPNSLLL